MLTTTLRAAALLCLTLAVSADTPAPGWQISDNPSPVFGATSATLGNGDVVTWDGLSVDRWTAGGAFVGNLATFPVFGFPSFCVVRPDQTAVIVGESSQQTLSRIALNGSGASLVANVTFNFAAAFENNTQLIVSAAASGLGNDILRVNVDSGASVPIANVSGPSGPVALDASGTLYYATQDPGFPAALGSTDVLSWSAAQINSGLLLDETDAQVVSTGFDGGSALAVDPVSSRLYLAETNFGSGQYRLLQVGANQASSAVVVDATNYISNLEFVAGPGTASFEAFQPADGSQLKYSTTDFFSVDDHVLVRPLRPTLTISGPGTTGIGIFTFEIDGALPNSASFLLFQSQSTLLATENTYTFPGFLLHSRLVPGQIRRIPLLLPTDGNGHGEVSYYNPGNLIGVFGWQSWITTPTGVAIGSTPVATL